MHIEFDMTDAMSAELTRLMRVLNMPGYEVFCKAFTLLRIHVEAARQGMPIYRFQKDGYRYPQPRDLIELPFKVDHDA